MRKQHSSREQYLYTPGQVEGFPLPRSAAAVATSFQLTWFLTWSFLFLNWDFIVPLHEVGCCSSRSTTRLSPTRKSPSAHSLPKFINFAVNRQEEMDTKATLLLFLKALWRKNDFYFVAETRGAVFSGTMIWRFFARSLVLSLWYLPNLSFSVNSNKTC